MTSDALSTLATLVGAKLKASRGRLVTAESCTGGWAAQAMTSVSGSSEWFERGFVVYSNDAKRELLGVGEGTLEHAGAVSVETVREMASGALARGRGTISLAITGVAGPSGGTAEKPVGTVCFAWAWEGGIRSEIRHFTGDRESVRRQSVMRALQGVLELLETH